MDEDEIRESIDKMKECVGKMKSMMKSMMDEHVKNMTVDGLRHMSSPVLPIDVVLENNPDMDAIAFYKKLKDKFHDDDEAMELIRGLVKLDVLPGLYGNELYQEILDEFGLEDTYGDMEELMREVKAD